MSVPTPKRISAPNSRSVSPTKITPSITPKRISSGGSTPTHQNDKQEKFKSMIRGYTTIDKDMCIHLQEDDFIRYIKTNGDMIIGGYIVEIRMYDKSRVDSLVLSSAPKKQHGERYEAKVADMHRIYKRPSSSYYIEHMVRNEQLRTLTNEINALKARDNNKIHELEIQVTMLTNKLNELSVKLKKN